MNQLIKTLSLSFICIVLFNLSAQAQDQFTGDWVVKTWVEKYGGGLKNGKLKISYNEQGNLQGILTGSSLSSGQKIIEGFRIEVLSESRIKMHGQVIQGDWFADTFFVDIDDTATVMDGICKDTAGDTIKVQFVKLEAPMSYLWLSDCLDTFNV